MDARGDDRSGPKPKSRAKNGKMRQKGENPGKHSFNFVRGFSGREQTRPRAVITHTEKLYRIHLNGINPYGAINTNRK